MPPNAFQAFAGVSLVSRDNKRISSHQLGFLTSLCSIYNICFLIINFLNLHVGDKNNDSLNNVIIIIIFFSFFVFLSKRALKRKKILGNVGLLSQLQEGGRGGGVGEGGSIQDTNCGHAQ